MPDWLSRHAAALQGLSGILTAVIALAALVGVKYQINASERLQREQSARDIYREFLNLSVSRPDLAQPDYCALVGSEKETAYENYVEYMLYTAEQAISSDDSWAAVFAERMKPHAAYICLTNDWTGLEPQVRTLVSHFKATGCANVKACAK